MQKEEETNKDGQVVADAVSQGVDLVEQFYTEYLTGLLGNDQKKAQALFLYRHGLNSNPDEIDE